MSENKLVLIDGHALAYRQFFGLPIEGFTTKTGEPTNATFGFTGELLNIILRKNPPKYLAVSFDVGKTFRDDWFPEYKGTREKMPDELRLQIERIKKVVQAFNIPILAMDGYEADDVLGTLARIVKPMGVPVHILTGDRDLLQLVNENTTVELPKGRFNRGPQVYDTIQSVVDKLGVRPDQVVDYKAIVGDSSDNIPGVKGVGEKTAVKLLGQYDTLDVIYENLEEIQARYSNKLRDHKETAYLSQKLARIVTDVPIDFELAACEAQDFDPKPVLDIFRELEFQTHTQKLREAVGSAEEDDNPFEDDLEVETGPEPTETVIVRTEGQLKAMVASLITSELVSFDLETTSLNKMTAEIVGIAICGQSPRAYYIPVGHVVGSAEEEGQMDLFAEKSEGISLAPDQLPLEKVLKALKPVMTDPDVGKVAHNAKFDYAILKYHGLEVTPIVFDTMIGEWLTNPSTKFKKLKELSTHRLMITMTEIQALIGKGKKAINFAAVPIDDAAPYAAADADVTLRLVEPIKAELGEQNMENLVELEMALIPVLTDMETAGIGVNRAFFKEMAKELGQELTELESAIHTIAGRSFNMNSTQQLSDVLFKELNIPHEGVKKTKSGHFSTNAQILNDLKPQDETGIIEKILQYREYNKLKSTYVDALPQMINQKTNRIHTNFNQTGTVTGRVASNDPNLQNIPIRTEVGRRIRRGFVAKPGHRFIAADYSQVELRILAHISQDEALINAFRNDQDIHRTTAAAVYGIEPEEVQFEQRRFAKNVNFGLMYGMGAFRLARESELTLAESREFIETYFKRFPAVRRYLDGTKELARQQGYVETLLGRRRYFPIFKTPGSEGLKAQAEREAINHPIQGTAADIIKIAMIELHKILSANYKTKMILQIHDELILEAPEDEIEEIKPLMEKTMSQAYKLDVPLKVEASVGKNWLDVKD